MNKFLILLLITVLFPLNALAADKENNFAVKGLAAASCATFVQERAQRSQTYGEAMAWLTGYLSAYNYLKPDTYDIAPWQSAELLSFMLASHCEKNPDESFFLVTNKLINSIEKDRLRLSSEMLAVSVGDYKLTIYKDVVFRIQSALKERGHLKMRWPTGDYDQSTIEAMKAFQTENKIKATGAPDQESLFILFSK